mmetsp:Transcript_8640/g.21254  ORF Transcript_8640/g.21254 Transcript_8640/m.21254 type:complete len:476 (-) Transcript_8640:92-1519(-)
MGFAFRSKIAPRNSVGENKRGSSKLRKKSSKSRKERNDGLPAASPSKRLSSSSRSPSAANSLRVRTSSFMSSLGTGSLGRDGSVVSFVPSPKARSATGVGSFFTSPRNIELSGTRLCFDGDEPTVIPSTTSSAKSRIIGRCCSFLRVSDLSMDDESVATTSVASENSYGNEPEEHTYRPVVNPPPGIEIDPKERWIALCTTLDKDVNDISKGGRSSEHTPIAPKAVECLANYGMNTALDESMWQPDSKSEKLIKKASDGYEWMGQTFKEGMVKASSVSDPSLKEILVWSGSYKHEFYGSEVPAIRSAGVVNTSAKQLMELLVDSNRVKEYNKLSLGRTDLITFGGNLEEEGPFGKSITKVMKSESKPPMMSALSLTSVLHAKKIPDGSGYLIVYRSVHRPEEETVASSMKTEIVMGVNFIVDFDDNDQDGTSSGSQKCLMININHMRSPMVPMYIAKKVAVTTAHKFINDIRALV